MALYKRGNIWWYKFKHEGLVIRESAETEDRAEAVKAERARHTALDKGTEPIKKLSKKQSFAVAAREWLELKSPDWSDSNVRLETRNFKFLSQHFRRVLHTITPGDVAKYKTLRKQQGASARTIGMELGSLRALLRHHRLWANLQPSVTMPKGKEDVGRALSSDEEHRLLVAAKSSRSRSLYPAVLLSLHSGLRSEELRLLRWRQVNLLEATIRVGKSKTVGGTGRSVPLSHTALECLKEWRSQFTEAKPEHFVFPVEKYAGLQSEGSGHFGKRPLPYFVDPTKPIGSFRTSWTTARRLAGVSCRWHDMRHSFVSRLAEGQASDSTIMSLSGHLSKRMLERYSHTSNEAKRRAVAVLDRAVTQTTLTRAERPGQAGH